MKKFLLIATSVYLFLIALLGVILICFFNSKVISDLSWLYLLVFWIPIAGWLITTGIGLLLKSNWARISVLLMSGLGLLLGLYACFYDVFAPYPKEVIGIEFFGTFIKTILIGIESIFLILLPVICIVFFTRPSIKDEYRRKKSKVSNIDLETKQNSEVETIKEQKLKTKWFNLYLYFVLPAIAVLSLFQIKKIGYIEAYLALYVILIITAIFGLYRRKLWGWNLNWIIIVMYTASLTSLVTNKTKIPYWILLVIKIIVWFLPNLIYFKRRKQLFSGKLIHADPSVAE